MTTGITAELLDGGLAEDLAAASLAMARSPRAPTLPALLGYDLWASTQRAFQQTIPHGGTQ